MRKRVSTVALAIGVAVSGVLAAVAVPAVSAPKPREPIYLNRAYSPEERAADLVSRLTLAEKASQMNSSLAAAIPRLGIAAYSYWNEAAHGVAREGTKDNANPDVLTNTTSYPVDLSLGSTWNPDLMYAEASMISDEAREVVKDNRLDLNFYSPTVNLARDPRWGRNDEAFSEDPLLTSEIAAQFVNGLEGKDQSGNLLRSGGGYLKAITTLKHFAANNSEFNRLTGSSDMDERTLREYYTAQFRDIVRRSDPGSMMSSYNRVNGVPAAADVHLIDTLARQTFGFDGFFTSDCDAIYEIQAGHHWQPPGAAKPLDELGRTAYANSAGEDLDCNQGYHDKFNYANTIPNAVAARIQTQTGVYTENDVDVSLTRLFAARIATGEFDDEAAVPWVAQARARIAPGTWVNDDSNNAVTQTPERLAMARRVAGQSIVLLKNGTVGGADKNGTVGGADKNDSAGSAQPLLPLRVPATGAYRVAVIGHFANPESMYLGGYSNIQGKAGKANEVNGYQGLKAAIQKINPSAVVDFLPGTDPNSLDRVDAASVEAAANYDAVIVYAGTDDTTAAEESDRSSLALPGAQASLISQVAARNPRTIVYVETIGQVDLAPFQDAVPALLWSSYNGQRKGEALADVLLGAVNPSGRLPFSWYADASQLPALDDYAIRPSATSPGRTYMYYTGPVSYPFGYGLGYSDFRYTNLRVDRHQVDANGSLRVSADVTNTGSVAGAEVVQLYVSTPDAPAELQRPIKRLEGFQKISLDPHQTKRVEFTVDVPKLAFFDESANRYQVDTGRYEIQLGSSSADADIQQRASVRVTGALNPVPSVVSAKPAASSDAAQQVAQRVLFPAGTVVDPQLTVAMSDDTLYGYIGRGASRALPDDLRVRYHSNRPDVVSVRGDVIRTVGSGVATVTATVSYHGRQASTDFVVYVR